MSDYHTFWHSPHQHLKRINNQAILPFPQQDYQVDLYLRQAWVDMRLHHVNLTEPLDLNDPNLVKALWKPEVYFPNAKHAEFQFVTVPNVLVRINPMGEILYMLR